eukprot:455958-Pleurochrysis_carterae.AAC.3
MPRCKDAGNFKTTLRKLYANATTSRVHGCQLEYTIVIKATTWRARSTAHAHRSGRGHFPLQDCLCLSSKCINQSPVNFRRRATCMDAADVASNRDDDTSEPQKI